MEEFTQFLKFCKKHLKNRANIVKLIEKRHQESRAEYLGSSEFHNSLQITRAKIESNPKQVFLYIRDFLQELKSNKADEIELKKRKRGQTLKSDEDQPAKKFKGDEENNGDQTSATVELKSMNSTEPAGLCISPHSGRSSAELKILISEEAVCFEEKNCVPENSSFKESLESSFKSECLKRPVLSGEEHDFEVILNEDYSNGSTGSVLVNYDFSGIGKDLKDTCDSTVLDDHIIASNNEVKLIEIDENSKESFENDLKQNEDKSLKSSQVALNECGQSKSSDNKLENVFSSESLDKSPDSTTMELQEKKQRKEAISPGNFKDMFRKLKYTVRNVKECLPLSPLSTGENLPDSSSKVDAEFTNDADQCLLLTSENKEEEMNVDDDGNHDKKTEDESKYLKFSTGKSKSVHSLKLVKNNDKEKFLDDSNEQKGRNNQDCIVISSPEYCEKSNVLCRLEGEGFQNDGDSPLKIVRVASEACLDNDFAQSNLNQKWNTEIKADLSSKTSKENELSEENMKIKTSGLESKDMLHTCADVKIEKNGNLRIDSELMSISEEPDINAEDGMQKEPDINAEDGMQKEPDINAKDETVMEPVINDGDGTVTEPVINDGDGTVTEPVINGKDGTQKEPVKNGKDGTQKEPVKNGNDETVKEPVINVEEEINIEIDNAEMEMKSDEESMDLEMDNTEAVLKCSHEESTSDEGKVKEKGSPVDENKTEKKSSEVGASASAEGGAIRKKGSKRQIERLEKLLENIRDKIEELKEAEVDLDDEDSAYIMEEKYQKKFVKVWNKLCQIKASSTDTGRPAEKKFRYSGTRYPEINRKIEKFVNRRKCFPDYHDIKDVITSVNNSHSLHLKGSAIDRLAREAFHDVGDQLQKRREKDFKYTFLGHLPRDTKIVRNEDDPAYEDKSLQLKLEENKKVSRDRLNQVIEKFVQKQERKGDDEDEEEEEQDEEEDAQEEGTEDVDVPEMDQIINEESQDNTAVATDVGETEKDSDSQFNSELKFVEKEEEENDIQDLPEIAEVEQKVEMAIKVDSEPVTKKEEGEERKSGSPSVRSIPKPLENREIVQIDDDDDDDDVVIIQEDLMPRTKKLRTKNMTKESDTDQKIEEDPDFIIKLQSDILSKLNSMANTRSTGNCKSAGSNLLTKGSPSTDNSGVVVVDFTKEKNQYPKQSRSRAMLTKNLRGNSKGNSCNKASSVENKSCNKASSVENKSCNKASSVENKSYNKASSVENKRTSAVSYFARDGQTGVCNFEAVSTDYEEKEIMKQSRPDHADLTLYAQEKMHLIRNKPLRSEKPWGRPRLEQKDVTSPSPATLHGAHRNVKPQLSKICIQARRNQDKASTSTFVPYSGTVQTASGSSFKGTSCLSRTSPVAMPSGGSSRKSTELHYQMCTSAKAAKKGNKMQKEEEDDDIIILD